MYLWMHIYYIHNAFVGESLYIVQNCVRRCIILFILGWICICIFIITLISKLCEFTNMHLLTDFNSYISHLTHHHSFFICYIFKNYSKSSCARTNYIIFQPSTLLLPHYNQSHDISFTTFKLSHNNSQLVSFSLPFFFLSCDACIR